jgi:hypothetical protein
VQCKTLASTVPGPVSVERQLAIDIDYRSVALQQKPEMISECLPFTLILVIIFLKLGINNMANFSHLFISFERSKLKLTFLLIEY